MLWHISSFHFLTVIFKVLPFKTLTNGTEKAAQSLFFCQRGSSLGSWKHFSGHCHGNANFSKENNNKNKKLENIIRVSNCTVYKLDFKKLSSKNCQTLIWIYSDITKNECLNIPANSFYNRLAPPRSAEVSSYRSESFCSKQLNVLIHTVIKQNISPLQHPGAFQVSHLGVAGVDLLLFIIFFFTISN